MLFQKFENHLWYDDDDDDDDRTQNIQNIKYNVLNFFQKHCFWGFCYTRILIRTAFELWKCFQAFLGVTVLMCRLLFLSDRFLSEDNQK